MPFDDAIKTCFKKYADFNGRASRSEFWYFVLFTAIVTLALCFVGNTASTLFSLATLVPSTAVGCRRLHDTNRSGWMQLLVLIPLIGWIVIVVFTVQEAKEPNRFGPAAGPPPAVALP